uniref:glucan endo-1,3-beta-D-glucosidase n=1 Tax=Albugo laibachii Nc14 TaxID=890382 RepID=F0WZ63_9STRA|nr:AlNc14C413G11469 [Albugo laibachii Nc14]|eukprot:CCA26779.1 AlNc14C413G11469 [Albugo laibachii Nc14]
MLNQYIRGLILAFATFIRKSESLYGVAYDMADVKSTNMLVKDFQMMKYYAFEVVRVYTWRNELNISANAIELGLKLILTVDMDNIQSGCDIVNAKPEAFEAACMGNERLAGNSHTIESMISGITQFKGCLKQNVNIALCERITEFTGMDLTVFNNHVTYMLPTIHPFFSQLEVKDGMSDLRGEYQSLLGKYSESILGISETGFPSNGLKMVTNEPSLQILCKMFAEFRNFTDEHHPNLPFIFFMFADTSYKNEVAENSFGILTQDRKPKCGC